MRKTLVLAIVSLTGLATGLAPAGAQSAIGVSPGELVFTQAQPGQSYHGVVHLQNQFSGPSTFSIELTGETGAWSKTDPAGTITVPAKSVADVQITMLVPAGTGPGNRTGFVRFVLQNTDDPQGAGGTVHPAVAVHLDAQVGGQANVRITWLTAKVPDSQQGNLMLATWPARNDGNVRATAKAHATVTRPGATEVLAQGDGAADVEPGAIGNVSLQLGSTLAIGQYTVHFVSVAPNANATATVNTKVVAVGTQAPDGFLHAISNPVRVQAGTPVTFTAWFENTGETPIASARVVAQVTLDGVVQATLASGSVALPAHTATNLTFVWTPAKAGKYHIVGHAEYDAYKTPDTESLLEVNVASGPWILIFLVLGALGLLAVLLIALRRRRARGPPGP